MLHKNYENRWRLFVRLSQMKSQLCNQHACDVHPVMLGMASYPLNFDHFI